MKNFLFCKLWYSKILLYLFLLCASSTIQGQNVSSQSLESQKNELLVQIQEAKQQLQKIQSSRKSSLAELSYVKKKISLRLKAINLMNQQLFEIDSNINTYQKQISTHSQYIDELKKQYKLSITSVYKLNHANTSFFFLFSSNNFFELFERISFLRKYADMRVSQLRNIKESTFILQQELTKLSQSKQTQKNVLSEHRGELNDLQKEEGEKRTIAQQLKNDEKEISKSIKEKTKQWKKIKNTIERLIKEEIAKNKKRIKEEEKNKSKKNIVAKSNKNTDKNKDVAKVEESERIEERRNSGIEESALTYSDKDFNLAKNFKANRGKLPWPTAPQSSAIIMHFGKNKVTDESRITYDNSGLTLSVKSSSPVKCVFNGNVTNVQQMDEGYLVTIRHGEYWTVYTPVFDVSVKAGQDITTGTVIGRTSSTSQPELEFQILKETQFLNPEFWLRR